MKEMTINEIKQCAFDILLYLDTFCKEKGITYWLCGGTLIGAMRHKGFIPWDDDIDVMMPREEYNRLCSEFPKDGKFQLLTSDNTKNFPYAFGKIVDTTTIKQEPLRKKFQIIGVDIDVFPIDNYPDDLMAANKMSHDIEVEQRKLYSILANYSKGRNVVRTIARFLITAFWHITDDLRMSSAKKHISRIQQLSQQYNTTETNHCGIATIAHYGIKEMNEKSVYASSVEVEFEGHVFPAPVGYNTYLTNLYGDYMQLPPENKRETHHGFKAYWK